MQVPPLVAALRRSALEAGFPFSSEDSTGEMLAVLSASVRTGGRVLEIGTGMGVGLGWIVAGLEPREDVAVTTIEHDAERSAFVQQIEWPDWIEFVAGDVTVELPQRGTFDLIFADAEGGKWYGLDLTLSALNVGGTLLLDDLIPQEWKTEEERAAHLQKMTEIRERIYSDPRLIATEINHGTGLLLAARRR